MPAPLLLECVSDFHDIESARSYVQMLQKSGREFVWLRACRMNLSSNYLRRKYNSVGHTRIVFDSAREDLRLCLVVASNQINPLSLATSIKYMMDLVREMQTIHGRPDL